MSNKVRGFTVAPGYDASKVKLPKRGTKRSAGYDFFNNTGSDIVLEPGEISDKIPSGVCSYMLDDEVLKIYVRSSIGFKYTTRIVNGTPIIDSDFSNEIMIKLQNLGTKKLVVAPGDAFVQGIFTKYLLADGDDFETGLDRDGGFGSTTGKI